MGEDQLQQPLLAAERDEGGQSSTPPGAGAAPPFSSSRPPRGPSASVAATAGSPVDSASGSGAASPSLGDNGRSPAVVHRVSQMLRAVTFLTSRKSITPPPMSLPAALQRRYLKAGKEDEEGSEGRREEEEEEEEEEEDWSSMQWEEGGMEEAAEDFQASRDLSLHRKARFLLSGHVTNMLRMLQLMCEGHNADMQQLLRSQDLYSAAGPSDGSFSFASAASSSSSSSSAASPSSLQQQQQDAALQAPRLSGARSVNLLEDIIGFLENVQPWLDLNLMQHKPLLVQVTLQVRRRGRACLRTGGMKLLAIRTKEEEGG